jgi:hypothetical protein
MNARLNAAARFSGLLLWAYARHLFTFSVGAALGAAAGMSVTTLMFLALLRSRGCYDLLRSSQARQRQAPGADPGNRSQAVSGARLAHS